MPAEAAPRAAHAAQATDETPRRSAAARAIAAIAKWAFVAVPVAGLLELALHVRDTHVAASEDDWGRAKAAVAELAKPDDLVVVAPRWLGPVARMRLGPEIATLEREARPDETRFARAVEVSLRGARAPELEGWARGEERSLGALAVTVRENPSPARVLSDLVAIAANAGKPQSEGAPGVRVFRVERGVEQACTPERSSAVAGNLGSGPAIPAERFSCAGAAVGVTVAAVLDYTPRRCILAPPPGGAASLRFRFSNVAFGQEIHGHHALYVEAERQKKGADVTLTFRAPDGRELGARTHHDGEGWKLFEINTSDLAGQRGDLLVDVSAPDAAQRVYCFEADTR